MAVTMGHPIAAIATGHGRSGIGILRMSGEGCISLAAKVLLLLKLQGQVKQERDLR